jgi:hypothetical protein
MPDYRIYTVGDDGDFLRSEAIECPDDAAAIEATEKRMDSRDVELWQRTRKIAVFGARHSKDTDG